MGLIEIMANQIRVHNAANPDHGVACVCMDEQIRILRIILSALEEDVRARVDYILLTASKRH